VAAVAVAVAAAWVALTAAWGEPIPAYGRPGGGVRPDHPTPSGRPRVRRDLHDAADNGTPSASTPSCHSRDGGKSTHGIATCKSSQGGSLGS